MNIVLSILYAISFFIAVVTLVFATTSWQQMVGWIFFINATILLIGACIVRAIDKLNKTVEVEAFNVCVEFRAFYKLLLRKEK